MLDTIQFGNKRNLRNISYRIFKQEKKNPDVKSSYVCVCAYPLLCNAENISHIFVQVSECKLDTAFIFYIHNAIIFFLIRNGIKKKNYFCILKTDFRLFLIQYYLSVPC